MRRDHEESQFYFPVYHTSFADIREWMLKEGFKAEDPLDFIVHVDPDDYDEEYPYIWSSQGITWIKGDVVGHTLGMWRSDNIVSSSQFHTDDEDLFERFKHRFTEHMSEYQKDFVMFALMMDAGDKYYPASEFRDGATFATDHDNLQQRFCSLLIGVSRAVMECPDQWGIIDKYYFALVQAHDEFLDFYIETKLAVEQHHDR